MAEAVVDEDPVTISTNISCSSNQFIGDITETNKEKHEELIDTSTETLTTSDINVLPVKPVDIDVNIDTISSSYSELVSLEATSAATSTSTLNENTKLVSTQLGLTDGADSTVSSETEGPDTHSIISSSGETGGPDSDECASDGEIGVISHDELYRGMVIRQGETISFVADNLNEQIKMSSPSQSGASRSSRRSSFTSDACSSSVDHSPIGHKVLTDIEVQAKALSQSVDRVLLDLQTSLHSMSAITVGCMQTYKGSVEKTLDEVDTNIKLMYAFMAKCEELNTKMKEVHPVAEEINEIKRILDMFEAELQMNPS